MAKLMVIGAIADVELTTDDEDDQTIHATCSRHLMHSNLSPTVSCSWTKRYDNLAEATQYAVDHADRGSQ
jgi:hypothetical protein